MKRIIIIAALALASCEPKVEKPLIIIDKGYSELERQYWYMYQDKDGYTNEFYESTDYYKIGDTIK